MDKDKIIIGVVALVIGVLIGAYVLPSGDLTRERGYGMMERNEKGARNNIDQHFIEEMIPHHQGAIYMAKLAETKAVRNEIKTLAQDILKAQTKEIEDMRAWYKNWYGVAVPEDRDGTMGGMMHGGMGMHMDSMSGDLESLNTAQNFDLEFIRQMIPHHEMAVMMARMLASSTDRPEMQTLAKNIIDSQTKEIELMRTWQEKWQ